jgi:hypothetical protein
MNEEINFDKWESSIGRIILSCSRVEYELSRLYEKWMPDRSYYSDDYLSRFDKSIGVAKQSLKNGDNIGRKLIEMKAFSKYRHLVAHNPIHYSSDTGLWHIFDMKDEKIEVDLNDLENIASKAYKTSIDLSVMLRVNV